MPGATYVSLTPTRILDTRNGTGGLLGAFTSHVARTFGVAGRGGVPTSAIAVTGNLTVTGQTSFGYLYIGRVATNDPTSSTLNFPLGDDRANGVTVALGGGGTLSVTYVAVPGASAQVIFDVTGYFTPDTSGATYHALTPARVLDSRDGYWIGLSGASSPHVARTFTVSGHGGVPSNAIAVTGNLTVTGQTALGYLYMGPNAMNNPGSSTLNFPLGDDRANAVTVALGAGGTLSVTYVAAPGASAQVIFDVTGYFTPDSTGATYVALTQARILDSRDGTGLSDSFSSNVARTFGVAGHGGVPSNAIAVTGNLTVTGQTALGYLYMGPNAMNNPTSSTLNFPLGDDRANAVTVALGAGGTLSVTYVAVPGATAQVIFDVTGYFTPSSLRPVTWTFDVHDAGTDRWQDPDYTGCTAASTESMLNTIAHNGSTSGFVWQPTTSYSTQESILAFEREHMTMLTSSAGTDPHGWRNALNYYGWGSVDAGVYRDSAYSSFEAAAMAAVSAIAMHHEPVGILARSGSHGQVVTGYEVTGADPRTGSTDFSIVGVNLTDPLQSVGYRDTWIAIADWRSGGSWVRFSQYLQNDSPYQDPIDGQIGNDEWDGMWVIIDPVK